MKIYLLLFVFSLVFPVTKCNFEIETMYRSRPEKDTFSLSPTGHFMIHYDIQGNAAPDLTDVDGNGVPDYVDEVGIIADSTRYVLVDIMGFREEIDDSDGIYDIYIDQRCDGCYGVNTPDAPYGNGSYITIDNDYSEGYYTSGIVTMRLTVAHEFFHAIQRAYKAPTADDKFFYEMTSTWIEDIIVPDGNDYLYFITNLFNNPEQRWDNVQGYSLALFGHYLSTQFEENIQSQKESTIIRKVWEELSNIESPFLILNDILQSSYNSSFQYAWMDFMSRNFFNDIYTDMDNDIFFYIDQANEICTSPVTSAVFIDNDDSYNSEIVIENSNLSIQTIKSKEDAVISVNLFQEGDGYLGNIVYMLNNQNFYALAPNNSSEIHISQFQDNDLIYLIYISPESGLSLNLEIEVDIIPEQSLLLGMYPNPIFSGDAPVLEVDIHTEIIPQIIIYNMLGSEIVRTDFGLVNQGRHELSLSPMLDTKLSSGVYIIDLILDEKFFTRKLTVIK